MDTHYTNDILALMTPEEIRDALWMIDVFERWNMPADEAAEWRRRTVARQWFMSLAADADRLA